MSIPVTDLKETPHILIFHFDGEGKPSTLLDGVEYSDTMADILTLEEGQHQNTSFFKEDGELKVITFEKKDSSSLRNLPSSRMNELFLVTEYTNLKDSILNHLDEQITIFAASQYYSDIRNDIKQLLKDLPTDTVQPTMLNIYTKSAEDIYTNKASISGQVITNTITQYSSELSKKDNKPFHLKLKQLLKTNPSIQRIVLSLGSVYGDTINLRNQHKLKAMKPAEKSVAKVVAPPLSSTTPLTPVVTQTPTQPITTEQSAKSSTIISKGQQPSTTHTPTTHTPTTHKQVTHK